MTKNFQERNLSSLPVSTLDEIRQKKKASVPPKSRPSPYSLLPINTAPQTSANSFKNMSNKNIRKFDQYRTPPEYVNQQHINSTTELPSSLSALKQSSNWETVVDSEE